MERRANDRRLRRAVRLLVAGYLVLAAGTVASLWQTNAASRERAANRVEEIAANRRVAMVACERQNQTQAVLVRFLSEAREVRRVEGTLTPARAEFYREALRGLAPIDCAAMPREEER